VTKTYVLDTSVVVKWFVSEEDSDKAKIFLKDYEEGKIDIVVPSNLYYEATNVFWLKKQEGFTEEEALDSIEDLMRLDLEAVLSTELLKEGLKLAHRYEIAVYDSIFLALASERDLELVTADRRLYDKVKGDFSGVKLLKLI